MGEIVAQRRTPAWRRLDLVGPVPLAWPARDGEADMTDFSTRVVDATDIEFGELRRMLAALGRLGWQVREIPGISNSTDGRLRLVLVRQNQV